MNPGPALRRGYHDLLRRDILDLIPKNATSVLDLGCGTGALGKALKERQACRVDGIELSKDAANVARQNLDTVWHDNLNRFDIEFLKQKYDVLVFGDILEHLISPWLVLKRFSSALSNDGIVIASIPNVAHPWVISQLQKGLFRYELAGLLDVSHLRFFTKTTIGQLFYKAGLKIKSIEAVPSKENPIQYYVIARKPLLVPEKPLVTVLILTLNSWKFTAQCLDSLESKTTVPYKALVIDNASTDETVSALRANPRFFHIENSVNLGFARGFNVGLELIDTPYFAILNNDILLTKNWLKDMLKHLEADEKLMLVGPRSNYVSGPQLVQQCCYNDTFEMETYVKNFAGRAVEPLTYIPRIVFFCALFNSTVLNTVGLLDERFEMGNFEDDDYCLRIHKAGLKTAMVNKVFVHHYGSRTFRAEEIDYGKAMAENKSRFMKKWGMASTGG